MAVVNGVRHFVVSGSKYLQWVISALEKYDEVSSIQDLCEKIAGLEDVPVSKVYYSSVYDKVRFLESIFVVETKNCGKCVKVKFREKKLR